MATFSQAIVGSTGGDVAVPSSSISSLATTGFAIGAAIDNRPGSGTSADVGDFVLPLNSVTPTSGMTLQIAFLPAADSGTTNYASPNAAAAVPLNLIAGTYVAPGGAITVLTILGVSVPPYSFKTVVINNLGVSITASGNATLQRRTMTVA